MVGDKDVLGIDLPVLGSRHIRKHQLVPVLDPGRVPPIEQDFSTTAAGVFAEIETEHPSVD